ncbi:hypothetical protein OB919_20735 [Halobacteria archaeon AArc-curdl1]|uniref:Uncharacterized protein n=1 Tax=Natronosalvus hydrolyticus TaxID=2979988 RepID=A0AAP2ZBT9_9EURY|nr:hypothetical protein [Halobacteria archaeon AArc-curdl1]
MPLGWTAIGPVLGGVIAGITGLLTQEYISQVRQYEQEKQWYDRVNRLANRLIRKLPTDEELEYQRTGDIEALQWTLYRYLEVYPLLEDHIGDAPSNCPEEVVRQVDCLFELRPRYPEGTEIDLKDASVDELKVRRRDASEVVSSAEKLNEATEDLPSPPKAVQLRNKLLKQG